jgi:hypothetical protein
MFGTAEELISHYVFRIVPLEEDNKWTQTFADYWG